MVSSSHFTILRAIGQGATGPSPIFTKKYRADAAGKIKKGKVSLPTFFDVESVPCPDIGALYAQLIEMKDDPHVMHVRGQLNDVLDSSKVRRNKTSFRDVPRDYICLDFDNVKCPDHIDPLTESKEAGDYLVSRLPEEFQDVSYILQWSSSFGVEALMGQGRAFKTLKAHVWFFLDRPVANMDLKRWGKHINGQQAGLIDISLFNPVQPHFTAAPAFNGLSDPIGKRIYFVEREFDQVVIDIPENKLSSQQSPTSQIFSTGRGVEAYLREIGELYGFHRQIYKATCSYVSICSLKGLEPDFDYWKGRLRDVIESANPGHRSAQEIERYRSDNYLEDQFKSAVGYIESHKRPSVPESDHPPTYPDCSASLSDAREQLSNAVRDFYHKNVPDYWEGNALCESSFKYGHMDFSQHETPEVPVIALAPDVGVGKTYAVIKEALNWMKEQKSKYRNCSPMVVLVPTHKLAIQMYQDFLVQILNQNAKNIKVAVFRGMRAENPYAPDEKMCLDLARVKSLQDVGLSARKYACGIGSLDIGHRCPLMDTCAYWGKNMQDIDDADIIIMTHANYFLPPLIKSMRKGKTRQPGMVVIDENIIGTFIPERKIFIPIDDVVAQRSVPEKNTFLNDDGATAALMDSGRRLDRLVKLNGPGPIARQQILETGITAENLFESMRSEIRRIYQPDICRTTPDQKYQFELVKAKRNIKVKALVEMWRCLSNFLDKSIEELCVSVQVGDNSDLIVHGLKEPNEVYLVPTLILDATYEHEIYRRVFPTIQEKLNIEVHKPFQKVTQVVDTTDSMSSLRNTSEASETSLESRRGRCFNRLEFIKTQAALFESNVGNGLDGLVVGPKFLQNQFKEIGGLPENIDFANYGVLVGQNKWEDVKVLLVNSRPLPSVEKLEQMAEVLAARPIRKIDPNDKGEVWLPKNPYYIRKRNGKSCEVQNNYHPDPVANALINMITRGNIIQAIGRARGVNRNEETTLQVFVFTNFVVPITVDETVRLNDLLMDRFDKMILEGAVCCSAQDIALCYPVLFKSKDAAKGAMRSLARNRCGIPINNIIIEKTHLLTPLSGSSPLTHAVLYRTGKSGPWKTFIFNIGCYQNPEIYLREKLSKTVIVKENSLKLLEDYFLNIAMKRGDCHETAPDPKTM